VPSLVDGYGRTNPKSSGPSVGAFYCLCRPAGALPALRGAGRANEAGGIVYWGLTLKQTCLMPQRVIVEPFSTDSISKGVELKQDSIVSKALADGWRIAHSSSAVVAGLSTLYVTFVLEKADAPITRDSAR
jgi:hypothetical protein